MEVLFSDSLASLEAYVILACVIIFVGLYFYDGYDVVRKIFAIIWKKNELNTLAEEKKEIPEMSTTSEIPEEIAIPLEKNEEGVPTLTIEDEETGKRVEVASPFLENITPEEIEEHLSLREKEKEEEEALIAEQNFVEVEEVVENDDKVSEEEKESIIPEQDKEGELQEEQEFKNEEESPKEEEDTHVSDESPLIEEDTSASEEEYQEMPHSEDEEKDTVLESISEAGEEDDATIEISQKEEVPQYKEKSPQSGANTTEVLFGLTNQVRTAVARGQILEARGLIIQGLALEKNHRDLNLILAELYENEKQFEKAEYIYKDLALVYQNDGEILEKLANVLIIERRYDVAREIYRQLVEMTGETEESLYILTHLSSELHDDAEKYTYARKYQKNWPNNPEILTLLAQAEIALGKRRDAIETLKRLKNLTPYNNEILETIQKLVLEEELAGNFGN